MSELAIALLGPPGAGKGTQAVSLAAAHRLPYLSTGDLLRAAARTGTQAGRAAKRFMDAGDLVPDALLLELLEDALPATGFLLDGFPRTLPQAEALGGRVGLAILLDVPTTCSSNGSPPAAAPTTDRPRSSDAWPSITSRPSR
jgi:adenylate kinase